MSKEIKKTCFNCHKTKPMSELENMGVWVCKTCLSKNDKKKKK